MSSKSRTASAPPAEFQRRALLLVISALAVAAVTGHVLAVIWGAPESASALALGGIPLAGALLLVASGRLEAAGRLTLASYAVLVTRLMYLGEGTGDIVVVAWPALALAAGLLLRRSDLYLFVVAAVAGSTWVAWQGPQGFRNVYDRNLDVLQVGVLALVLTLTALVADVLILNLRRGLSESLANERALRASEELFNRAFHASPAAMIVTRLSDRVVVDVNQAFLRAVGQQRDEVVGRPTVASSLWIDADEREGIYRELADKGTAVDHQLTFRRGGAEGKALVSGAVVTIGGEPCALFIALDVTERIRAEAALAESEERYRLISRVTSDYTFSTRVAEDGSMEIQWVAGAFERITGYSFDEFVAHGGWRAALHPDDVEADDRALERIGKRQPTEVEVRTVRADGEVRWVRVHGHPVWDERLDRLAGIHGGVKDITEQKRAELERESLIRELEAKNDELERFTYTASHDLKSPLLTVRGFLGHVVSSLERGDVEPALADLRRIEAATTRMGRLLDELLELSRIGRVVRPPSDAPFDEIVREALRVCAGRLEARGAEVRVHEGLPVVHGDRTRLVEVVQNLVENAVKFTPGDRVPRIEVGVRHAPEGPVFFVADEGAGVAPEHRQRVFGLFDKLDPESEGTGIGLALVHRIVQLHGGEVWVESDGEGAGSRFCFTLAPATERPAV